MPKVTFEKATLFLLPVLCLLAGFCRPRTPARSSPWESWWLMSVNFLDSAGYLHFSESFALQNLSCSKELVVGGELVVVGFHRSCGADGMGLRELGETLSV